MNFRLCKYLLFDIHDRCIGSNIFFDKDHLRTLKKKKKKSNTKLGNFVFEPLFAEAIIYPSFILIFAPIFFSASSCHSTGLEPMAQPPGNETLAILYFASKGPSTSTPARIIIKNVPIVKDVETMVELLKTLGSTIKFEKKKKY
jgi:hypothetical protein